MGREGEREGADKGAVVVRYNPRDWDYLPL